MRCVEVIGDIELFEPRRSDLSWPPYRRLGRSRGQLVSVADFGTSRERYAADDTWTDEAIREYVELRTEISPPFASGEIVPPNELATLDEGMHVPPGHLEALPRVFVADSLRGVALDAKLSTPACRLVVAALISCVTRVHRWARARSSTNLWMRPANIWFDVRIGPGGADARPMFDFTPSVDYAPHPEERLDGPERFMIPIATRKNDALSATCRDLVARTGASWAAFLPDLLRARRWEDVPLVAPRVDDADRAVVEAEIAKIPRPEIELAILAAPPPDAAVPRRETRQPPR